MKVKLKINANSAEELLDISLDSSSTISSWLIDHYFTQIYSKQIRISTKSIQPETIIGIHDMFSIHQILSSSSNTSIDFSQLCQIKFEQKETHGFLDIYNQYLKRCGLIDLIDLFYHCQIQVSLQTIEFNHDNIQTDLDRLFLKYFIGNAMNSENISKDFLDKDLKHIEPTISKNYIKHTLCTYLLLLLDTRNEHALIHCLSTPVRPGIERQTIVEIRRLTKLSKNECLTIYQILLSFLRRKELLLSRQGSQESNEDESFHILEKYYIGIKEFFDFIEQLQMTIEENEHLKIDSNITFRKLLTMISKQFRKDTSLTRCESIIKDVIEEFCQCFQNILSLMNCTSPIRSASSGGTLAGRRFLRSVAYLCTKQIIHLPIIQTKNEHYDSPSTGLRKAASARLLKSPLTPIPIVIELEQPIEEKPMEIPIESVFVWKEKKDRFRRRKSQRCLELSPIHEKPVDVDEFSTHSSSQSSTTRQPLGEIEMSSFHSTSASEKSQTSFSLASDQDQENVGIMSKKRTNTIHPTSEPAKKKQKKVNVKPLSAGQKTITTFFQSKN